MEKNGAVQCIWTNENGGIFPAQKNKKKKEKNKKHNLWEEQLTLISLLSLVCTMALDAPPEEDHPKRRASDHPDSPVSSKKREVVGEIANLDIQSPATKEETTEESKQPSPCSIYKYLHTMERDENKRPLGNYIGTVQKRMTNDMREILIDWLVEVTEEFKLISDTLYIGVSCIDRFLSIHPLDKNYLQLLGITAILIAS